MSRIAKPLTAALIALTIGGSIVLPGTAQAGPHCSFPPGATQPICVNSPPVGAVIGPVVQRPPQEPRCYYLPTVANGAVNGLRKVCD